MAQQMRKKVLRELVARESQKRTYLEQDYVLLKRTVDTLNTEIATLRGYLVEAGILEQNWTPEAPKGSTIKSNIKHFEPTYTKVNKVWE